MFTFLLSTFDRCTVRLQSVKSCRVMTQKPKTKKIRHPVDNSSGTSTGPNKKKTRHSDEGKQAFCQCRTVNTVWFQHELWEMRHKSASLIAAYRKRSPLETI